MLRGSDYTLGSIKIKENQWKCIWNQWKTMKIRWNYWKYVILLLNRSDLFGSTFSILFDSLDRRFPYFFDSDAEPWAKRSASASEGERLMEVNENQLEIEAQWNSTTINNETRRRSLKVNDSIAYVLDSASSTRSSVKVNDMLAHEQVMQLNSAKWS